MSIQYKLLRIVSQYSNKCSASFHDMHRYIRILYPGGNALPCLYPHRICTPHQSPCGREVRATFNTAHCNTINKHDLIYYIRLRLADHKPALTYKAVIRSVDFRAMFVCVTIDTLRWTLNEKRYAVTAMQAGYLL